MDTRDRGSARPISLNCVISAFEYSAWRPRPASNGRPRKSDAPSAAASVFVSEGRPRNRLVAEDRRHRLRHRPAGVCRPIKWSSVFDRIRARRAASRPTPCRGWLYSETPIRDRTWPVHAFSPPARTSCGNDQGRTYAGPNERQPTRRQHLWFQCPGRHRHSDPRPQNCAAGEPLERFARAINVESRAGAPPQSQAHRLVRSCCPRPQCGTRRHHRHSGRVKSPTIDALGDVPPTGKGPQGRLAGG